MVRGNGHDPDDDITAVETMPMPKAVNPRNRGIVSVLADLATAMRERAAHVRELAYTFADRPDPVGDIDRSRVADILQTDGEDEIRAAASIR